MLNGKDTAGNEITVQKKVVSLDLDMPAAPVINSNSGYAVLASYGIIVDSKTTIIYDTRTDISNYYSIDNGVTWLPYTGQFNMASGTIIAKSVKKVTGLEKVVSKTIGMPSDALTFEAYDNNDSTYTTMLGKYIKVDNSMWNQAARIKLNAVLYARINIRFMNESRQIIDSFDIVNGVYDVNHTVPSGTVWITAAYMDGTSGQGFLYEIGPANEPTFTATNGYMLLTADPTKAIKEPYKMVSISYFYTTVQRLYRIGTTGNWLTYNDQPIKVKQGETIYAKGIDQYGNETRTITSYTANVTDAIMNQAYDVNDTTYTDIIGKYMQVDSSMQGQKVRIKWRADPYLRVNINFLDENKTLISAISIANGSYDQIYTIPLNTKWIQGVYVEGSAFSAIYEIGPANEPVITPNNMYMLLTLDQTKAIKDPYQTASITYFPTSVQRLYRIGTTGDWLNYNDQPIRLVFGQIIYAKGIDQYGNETRLIPSFTSSLPDALTKEAFDGNDSTYTTMLGKYIRVDNDMQGRNMRLKLNAVTYARVNVRFMNESRQIISSFDVVNGMFDGAVKIPTGTVWISAVYMDGTSGQGNVYEIQVADEPTFSATDGYMNLSYNLSTAIKTPYQNVSINYFPTSVQRLYRIGTTGDWLNYNDQPIKVDQGQTIYAKGIDQSGKETRIISSYTTNSITAVGAAAYDGNFSTYFKNNVNADSASFYIDVDPSMQGKSVRISMRAISSSYCWGGYSILDSNGTAIYNSGSTTSYDQTIIVPSNAKKIVFGIQGNFVIYELQPL